ncbi:MAG: hypothetical protein K1X74_14405 [Pirellulales bacterium]|nr:hypothetical protein [Pirellulales bacterium]
MTYTNDDYHDSSGDDYSEPFSAEPHPPREISAEAVAWSSEALDNDADSHTAGGTSPVPQQGSPTLEPAAAALPTDPESRRDAADLQFMHVLLEQCFSPTSAEGTLAHRQREARVARVMAAVHAESAPQPVSTVMARERVAVRSVQGMRRRTSTIGRIAAILATAVAVSGVALFLSWTSSGQQTVQAAVDAMYRAAAQPKDRHYHVKARFQDLIKGTESHVVTDLYVRGGDKFVLRHPTMLGDLWIGSNGRQGWMVNPFNIVLGRKDPKLTLAWARDEGITMPELQLTALLDEARKYFDLELLPAEMIDPRESPATYASSQTLSDPYVAWQRIRCRPKSLQPHQPYLMDLWAHPDTGVMRRIQFHWQPFSKFCGLTMMTVDLVAEQPRPDAWYEPAAHLKANASEATPAAAVIPAAELPGA